MHFRYKEVQEKVSSELTSAQALLSHSQSVQENLDALQTWLEEAEKELSVVKSLPLNRAKLLEQRKEQQVLQSEVQRRRAAVESAEAAVSRLLASSPSAAATAQQRRLADLQRRYKLVSNNSRAWADNLNDAIQRLDSFTVRLSYINPITFTRFTLEYDF